jgi:hypothetical protein
LFLSQLRRDRHCRCLCRCPPTACANSTTDETTCAGAGATTSYTCARADSDKPATAAACATSTGARARPDADEAATAAAASPNTGSNADEPAAAIAATANTSPNSDETATSATTGASDNSARAGTRAARDATNNSAASAGLTAANGAIASGCANKAEALSLALVELIDQTRPSGLRGNRASTDLVARHNAQPTIAVVLRVADRRNTLLASSGRLRLR